MPPIAFVLAGGKGSRLASIVGDVPKPIAPIAGEPFLWLILRQLKFAGIEEVVLLTGYKAQMIEDACGKGERFGLRITYSAENQPLGTAGCLWPVRHLVNDRQFLVLNGDTYLDTDLRQLIDLTMPSNVKATIGVMPCTDASRFGAISFDPVSNEITSLKEKASTGSSFVNAGIYLLNPQVLDRIPGPDRFVSFESDVFPEILKGGDQIWAQPLNGQFCDIGIPSSYAQFNAELTLGDRLPASLHWTRPLFKTLLLNGTVAFWNGTPSSPALQSLRSFASSVCEVREFRAHDLFGISELTSTDFFASCGSLSELSNHPPCHHHHFVNGDEDQLGLITSDSTSDGRQNLEGDLSRIWENLRISKSLVSTETNWGNWSQTKSTQPGL